MRLCRLAFQNVKCNLKNYVSLVLSLSFSIMIFYNFQNLVYSDLFAAVGERSKDYSDMLIQMLSLVLGVFIVFFTGYATNVFLTKAEKRNRDFYFYGADEPENWKSVYYGNDDGGRGNAGSRYWIWYPAVTVVSDDPAYHV